MIARVVGAIVALGAVLCERAAHAQRCGDVTGSWSAVSDGLRMRLVTSGSVPDRSALRVSIDLQNTSSRGIELHWEGRPEAGWAEPGLRDARGADVADPPWRLGGNEPVGRIRLPIDAGQTVRVVLSPNIFTAGARRLLRIGAFWAREMPADGSRRFFYVRTRTSATPLRSPSTLVREADGSTAVRPLAGVARFAVWRGRIELPAVCVD